MLNKKKSMIIKSSRNSYRFSYIIGFMLIPAMIFLDIALLMTILPLGLLAIYVTIFFIIKFSSFRYIYLNYDKLVDKNEGNSDQKVEDHYLKDTGSGMSENKGIGCEYNQSDYNEHLEKYVLSENKEVQMNETSAELYLKQFNYLEEYDISKEFTENEINKLKRSREVEHEKFIKYSGTTQRPEDFVVFDLETTGLNSSNDEIIEIGAIKFLEGFPEEVFHTYIKPTRKISKRITNINGITNEMVEEAPSIEEVLPKFIEFVEDKVLIAHNAPFDMKFILENLYRYGYKKLKNKVIDTLKLSRQKVREYDYEKDRDVKLESYKLSELNWRFELNLPSHNAVDDCKTCAYVYLKIIEECGDVCYVEI